MALLIPGKPQFTKVPYIRLDGLKAGIYRFQLRVFDSAGNVSRADTVTIKIAKKRVQIQNVNLVDNVFNRSLGLPRPTIR